MEATSHLFDPVLRASAGQIEPVRCTGSLQACPASWLP
ncbi:MAG: hypothetical protein AVDCRST_MAG21-1029 [uncultured Nocardioidaceae bacterium]|uniref:Uncharacterized protein n=1 Tax=uncultured Nocardioidaceae bacterium TaxID=253824 RepID=A0A6J4N5P7_9ACTN|nr:MAG: hypothetical protein AVDCRST_MAG21-1029 [uncultured Nocardioidaceae bacterium]